VLGRRKRRRIARARAREPEEEYSGPALHRFTASAACAAASRAIGTRNGEHDT
jgi:hypothetical protein